MLSLYWNWEMEYYKEIQINLDTYEKRKVLTNFAQQKHNFIPQSSHSNFVQYSTIPDSKINEANIGPTWVLSAPDGPHVGPMNLSVRDIAFGSTVTPQYINHNGTNYTHTSPSIVTFVWLLWKSWITKTYRCNTWLCIILPLGTYVALSFYTAHHQCTLCDIYYNSLSKVICKDSSYD